MSLVILLVLTGVLVAFGAYAWLRRRPTLAHRLAVRESIRGVRPVAVPVLSRKPGCMINPGPACCRPARRIEAAWYPKDRAPRLPLDTCETPTQCRCSWMQVLDRRVTQQPVESDRRGRSANARRPR